MRSLQILDGRNEIGDASKTDFRSLADPRTNASLHQFRLGQHIIVASCGAILLSKIVGSQFLRMAP